MSDSFHEGHLRLVTDDQLPDTTMYENALQANRRLPPDFIQSLGPPRYGGYEGDLTGVYDYNLTLQLQDLEIVESGAMKMARTAEQRDEIERDFAITREFIAHAHREYRNPTAQYTHVFTVPMRINRDNYEQFIDEAVEHTPFVRHSSAADAIHILANTPPVVLDTYQKGEGAVLLMPLFGDMTQDLNRQEQLVVGSQVINDTAAFAARLGATTMGLGATIPRLTHFGDWINKPEGLVTTTGHAGTVHLIDQTVRHVMASRDLGEDISIGVLGGGGSIGSASLEMLVESFPSANFKVFDIGPRRLERVMSLISTTHPRARVEAVSSNAEAIINSPVVVSAVLGSLSLSQMGLQPNDVHQTVFIDDTQPPAIDVVSARELGATVSWPLAIDQTGGHMTTKRIVLGDRNGLSGTDVVFGCTFETYAVSQHSELAITSPVNPEMVRQLGQTAGQYVKVDRLISFGQKQELNF